MSKTTAHIISHTHWDREWYRPYEKHHMQLIDIMDSLIELLDNDEQFLSFHLDGQTIILDDYLEVRPAQREKVLKLVREGRLMVGPWYVLQDEFLTSSEANARNLQIGMRDAAAYGGSCLIGYFPDSFGNMGQAPQILAQAGISCAVFGRGVKPTGFNNAVYDSFESPYSEMWWQSPDGSKVLGVLFANWYNNGMEIPADADSAAVFWNSKLADARRFASTEHLLFMNGCDHQPVQLNLSQALEATRELYPDIDFVHASWPEYIEQLSKEVPDSLVTVEGELRSQKTDGWGTLVNTASARVYIKQANQRGQALLERAAEPLAAMAALTGASYPHDKLTFAWKTLMQNHPHDSICGCSVDEVHAEMMTRFAKSAHAAESIIEQSLQMINASIDLTAFTRPAAACSLPFTVYNTTGWERTGVVAVELDIRRLPFSYDTREASLSELGDLAFAKGKVMDAHGREILFALEDLGVRFGYELPSDKFRQPYLARTIRLHMLASDVPQMGYRTYAWVADHEESQLESRHEAERVESEPHMLDNRYLNVVIQEDGRLTMTDKRSGRSYHDLLAYENAGDIGNEYMFRQPNGEQPITTAGLSAKITLKERSELRTVYEIVHEWDVPACGSEELDRERRELVYFAHRSAQRSTEQTMLALKTTVTLEKDAKKLDVVTMVNNTASDYRLRVLFPTDIAAEYVEADSIFEVARRRIQPEPEWNNPSHCQHQQAFVSLHDEQSGLTVANLGLNEYEVLRDGRNTLAITLLRAVGELGDWGYFPTPDAQCQGMHTFTYSIIPFAGEDAAYESYIQAYQLQTPWHAKQHHQASTGLEAPERSFLTWHGEGLALSAFKLSEETGDLIVRWYTLGAEERSLSIASLPTVTEWYESNLLERKGAPMVGSGNGLALKAGGYRILTLGARCKS
ncbi:alpha-mannosidase [Paenibacillus sp. JDR-2]|uniref:alpha-mannosidase n=1 Tax=Paenibacillus sp. (strain JDR-2) TaxID=324057 RepID=UPI0001666BD2|nr:alpha-mannosidase [Paenibacillus sp. JDR-2]ACT01221.1 glycoside hydrolase family 38 [Paenibacillus sp. JDR-2]